MEKQFNTTAVTKETKPKLNYMSDFLLQVVIVDTVIMTTMDDKVSSGPPQACLAHDYDTMKPVVLATWKHGFQGACPDKSAILAESQASITYLYMYTLRLLSNPNIVNSDYLSDIF